MTTLYFPGDDRKVKKRYYEAYYMSTVRSARHSGLNVVLTKDDKVWTGGSINAFSCKLDKKQFIMDFSDLKPFQLNPKQVKCPYFKWQYSTDREDHEGTPNVFSLAPLQDYRWDEFEAVRKKVRYKANGDIITNNQRARAAATGRRNLVRGILRSRYRENVRFEFIKQYDWWLSHNDCLAAVHVPGARNDMLDRGQLELMGLGVCVISPAITTVLGDTQLHPYIHYVPVLAEWPCVIDAVEWCRGHREKCIEIGQRAKELFDSIVPPDKYWAYIRSIVNA